MHRNPVQDARLIEPRAGHLDAHEEVEALLIDDLPIPTGTQLDRKEMDEQTIFSIETEPETAVCVNEWAASGTGGSSQTLAGPLLPVSSRR